MAGNTRSPGRADRIYGALIKGCPQDARRRGRAVQVAWHNRKVLNSASQGR